MAGGKSCRLCITGLQYPPGVRIEPVATVQEVCAEYFYKNGSHYLFYEEQPEGCAAVLKTRVKRKGGRVELCRQGVMAGTMVFEAGGRYRTEYPTPFGALLLDIVTESVEVAKEGHDDGLPEAESGGDTGGWLDVRIRYLLEDQGEVVGEYELSIQKKPVCSHPT